MGAAAGRDGGSPCRHREHGGAAEATWRASEVTTHPDGVHCVPGTRAGGGSAAPAARCPARTTWRTPCSPSRSSPRPAPTCGWPRPRSRRQSCPAGWSGWPPVSRSSRWSTTPQAGRRRGRPPRIAPAHLRPVDHRPRLRRRPRPRQAPTDGRARGPRRRPADRYRRQPPLRGPGAHPTRPCSWVRWPSPRTRAARYSRSATGPRRSALRWLLRSPGDTVLVAGKGHERGQEIAGVVYPFDDRDVLARRAGRGAVIALELGEVAKIVGGRLLDADPATVVSGPVEYDSRKAAAGGLFLALPGAACRRARLCVGGAGRGLCSDTGNPAGGRSAHRGGRRAGRAVRAGERRRAPADRDASSASPARPARPPPRTWSHTCWRSKAPQSLPPAR